MLAEGEAAEVSEIDSWRSARMVGDHLDCHPLKSSVVVFFDLLLRSGSFGLFGGG